MSPNAVLERERRWARPAAITGFLAALLLIAGVVERLAVPQESNASDQLVQFANHGGALKFSAVLMALGFLAAAGPLVYLFGAAAARSPRVRPVLVVLCVIGPLLFGVRLVMASYSLASSGDDFVAQQASEARHDLDYLQQQIKSKPDTLTHVTIYNPDNAKTNVAEVEQDDGTFYTLTFPAKAESDLVASLDKAGIDQSEDSAGKRGDAFANHLALNSSGFEAAGALALPAGLAMIFAIIYPALQAFRVGLITRLFSTVGAIAGASLIILPLAPALIGLWVAWLALIMLDRQPRTRGRAWETGTAVPWPRPGDPPPEEAPIEGAAREVDPDAPAPNPARQRGERRKRKSRG